MDTASIVISEDGKYECDLKFGNNENPRKLVVEPDGTVKMTDLSAVDKGQ